MSRSFCKAQRRTTSRYDTSSKELVQDNLVKWSGQGRMTP
jgi:hypothetical protein